MNNDLPHNMKEIITAFNEWYAKDDHSKNEDLYKEEINYAFLNGLDKDSFISFFEKFIRDGGGVQSGGHRNARLIKYIKENVVKFKKGVLEPFDDAFKVSEWFKWVKGVDGFGQGISTIYLNRVNKSKYCVVNSKSINAYQELGYKIDETSLLVTYNDLLNAQNDLITRYPELENFYKADSLSHFLIGTDIGKVMLPNQYFTVNQIDTFRQYVGKEWNKESRDHIEAKDVIKSAHLLVKKWATKVHDKIFSNGPLPSKNLNALDQSTRKKFRAYLPQTIVPKKSSPEVVAYWFCLESDGNTPENKIYFRVSLGFIDDLTKDQLNKYPNFKQRVREVKETYGGDDEFKKSFSASLLSSDALKLTMDELSDWAINQIHNFPRSYDEICKDLGLVSQEHINSDDVISSKEQAIYSLNQILYGPPGTGKTYNTVSESLKIFQGKGLLEENDEEGYLGDTSKLQFDALKLKGHIEFITFHQSFSYEDFVEGIRAETNYGTLSYSIKDGIFKKIAIEALYSKFEAEFSEEKINVLWEEVKAKTTDTYFNSSNYVHKKLILSACKLADFKKGKGKPYVLIIDEINRGNTSRVFGELITLIETTKRAGTDEAIDAILPYSQETFTVPDNLYIIGTMNTADRSLALMDTALRRRFDFIEMMPKPELIKDINIEGIKLELMLQTINDRIEALYDREHTIGHAFFMKLTSGSKVSDLALIFKNNILPLLEEYFFEDWEKITKVLGKSNIYIKKNFDNLGFDYPGTNYSRNDSALENKDTYINIYKLKDIDPDQAQSE